MRIALFTETYPPQINGVATHVKSLKDGLEQLGHQVLIVTADINTRRHYLKDNILHCPALEMKRLYGYGLSSPVDIRRLRIISWMCFLVGAVCLASMAYYVFWGIIGACMSFMGLLIRVIKNAFERAKELKEEVDYTI